jgi:hypothetical protein
MQLDEQVRDAFVAVQDVSPDVDSAWESMVGRWHISSNHERPRRWRVGLAAAAAVLVAGVAILVGTIGGGSGRVVSRSTGDQESPLMVVQLDVRSGATPTDSNKLIRSIEAIVTSETFRADLASEAAIAPNEIEIRACRVGETPLIDVDVAHPDGDTARALAREVSPTIRRVLDASQRDLPVEQRIAGPIFTELSVQAHSGANRPCGN